jgi:thiamine biosynthesis protein ThiS
MLILRTPDVSLLRPVRLLHPRFPLYVVPRTDHHFMAGATMIESQSAGRVTARSMMELLGATYTLHPAFGEAEIVETGVGVRPAFPDNLPRVEARESTVAINGLYRHGFLLAPAMARQAAELVFSTTNPWSLPMKLIVNGQALETDASTLAKLLAALDYEGDWLAKAVNSDLVHKASRAEFQLSDGDRIEILSPMQRG